MTSPKASERARREEPGATTPRLYIGSCALAAAIGIAIVATGCKRSPPTGASPAPGASVPLPAGAHVGATIPTSPAHAAYVTDNGSDTIAVLDRDGDTVTAVPVDVDPDAHEAPHHLAVDAAGGFLYVALAFPPEAQPKKSGSPHAGHGRSDRDGLLYKLKLADLTPLAVAEVDENPGDVLLTHDRRRVLVSHYDMQRAMRVAAAGGTAAQMFASVQAWDTASMAKQAERPLCVAPHGMVTSRDDRTLVVACYGSDELAIVDLTSPNLATSRLALASDTGVLGVPRYGPYAALFTADEKEVVAADLESDDLRVFDLASRTFLRAIPLGAKAMVPSLAADGTVVVPLQAPDGVARVDVGQGVVVSRASFDKNLCQAPHMTRMARDGRLYMVCEGDHVRPGSVVELDAATLAVKKRWVVGVFPDGIDFGDTPP